jgi:hypothetical protein
VDLSPIQTKNVAVGRRAGDEADHAADALRQETNAPVPDADVDAAGVWCGARLLAWFVPVGVGAFDDSVAGLRVKSRHETFAPPSLAHPDG